MRKFFHRTFVAARDRLARFVPEVIRNGCTLSNIKSAPAASLRMAQATPGVCMSAVVAAPAKAKRTIKASPRAALVTIFFVTMSFVHVFGDMLRYGLRNWKAFMLMALSLALLTVGFVRLHDYSVPMLRGDFEHAGKGKTEFDFADKDTAPQPEMFGQETLFDQAVIATLHATWKATDTVVGDRIGAKYNHGFNLYQSNQYEDAVTALNKAYAALSDGDGKVKPKYHKLASEIQFLIGNAYANKKKDTEAIAAYKLSLTFDPNNLVTIYNLERLLSSGGGKGGNDGDKPKPSNPQNTKV